MEDKNQVQSMATQSGQKKWIQHLWGFIMMFLAVFCGFLTENFREKQSDRKHEKQYIQSMIEDVKADSAQLTSVIVSILNTANGLDTLSTEFSNIGKGFSPAIYRNLVHLIGYEDLIPNDRTLQQLKNAGGMRLIRNEQISDSIMLYDKKIKDLLIEQTVIAGMVDRFLNMGDIIDARLWSGNFEAALPTYIRENRSLLITDDKKELNKYHMWIILYKAAAWNYLIQLTEVQSYASRLIRFMQNEYHLK